MALRGKRGKDLKKSTRAKILLSGPAGCGKSTLVAQIPRTYIIDTEDGVTSYGDLLEQAGSHAFRCTDPKEVFNEVRQLLKGGHGFTTIAIDPVTNLWHQQLTMAEAEVGEAFGKHYTKAGEQTRELVLLLLRLDMNIIFTCHEKGVFKDSKDAIVQSDTTYDGWKKSDYFFDLWLALRPEEVKHGQEHSVRYTAKVRKTRIDGFPPFEEIPLGEYKNGEKHLTGYRELVERFGGSVFESAAAPAKLATAEQVAEARALIEKVQPPGEWLVACYQFAEAAKLEDFSEENLLRFTDKLRTMKG